MSNFPKIFALFFLIGLTFATPLLKNVEISDNSEKIVKNVEISENLSKKIVKNVEISENLSKKIVKNVEISENLSKKIEKSEEINYRLPRHAIPSQYWIKLRPIIEENDFSFTGESTIKITITEAAKNITLHARDLIIDEAKTVLINDKNSSFLIKPRKQTLDNKTDFLVLEFDAIEKGEYTLNLNYEGKLHEDLNGFYRSWYINAEGKKVWLATTQFEPTWARRAFPCFDEPSLKSRFQISLNHDRKHSAISNMMEENSSPDNSNYDRKWTNFRNSPKMSTYLIAFVVSDFSYKSANKGRFTVWSRPNAIETGNYALNVGEKALKMLDDWTTIGHSRHVDKMDNFAIPQFRAGAMENWGLVTYRESALLFDENTTTTNSKQGIATVISHEFAHQWFGNLVSPLWWDYTWLNEGFANYFQYYITEQIEDNWRLMDQFVVKNLQETAFIADDNEDQHPMNGAVSSPLEISKFFDSITYSKAGCVIRMISHVLTEKVFQKGLQSYLTTWSEKAATPDALFTELLAAAASTNKDIQKSYLESWADQAGYPVITVIRNYTAANAAITQHRFFTKKTKEQPEAFWFIPLNWATGSKPDFEDTKAKTWFKPGSDRNATTVIEGVDEGWIIVNKQQTGYYRVNYDSKNWQLIIDHLTSKNYTQIHVLNRAQLLDDAFNLAKAGELSDFEIFLKLSKYLKQEVDYAPWVPAFRAIGALNKALANTEKHHLFKLYILRVIEKLEQTVGYVENKKDDHVTKFNRISAITWACYAGSKNCLSAAQKQLEDHINGTQKISPDLRSVILCSGVRGADATTWQKTFDYLLKSKNAAERAEILAALGCSADAKILNSFLAKTLAKDAEIPPSAALKAVLIGNSNGVNVAFDFIDANLKKIVEINKNELATIVEILNEIGARMTTTEQVKKLEKFIAANKDLAEGLKAKALANAQRNLDWIKKHKSTIEKFLDGEKLVTTTTPTTNKPGSSSALFSNIHLIFLALGATVFRFY